MRLKRVKRAFFYTEQAVIYRIMDRMTHKDYLRVHRARHLQAVRFGELVRLLEGGLP